jgi:cardiolipin synthase
MDRTVLHAKAAIVDGEVLLAGSANLDYRSFRHNLELAVNVFDPEVARRTARAFEADFATARVIELPGWDQRPRRFRIAERLAWSLRYWL